MNYCQMIASDSASDSVERRQTSDGLLGRARFQSDATGAFSRTRLAWCVDVANNDIPGGYERVNCPVGARYRVRVDSTGEQKNWDNHFSRVV